MRLWRLTRLEHQALDGAASLRYGGRYASPGHRLVSFASEAGLAVLVTLRYWQDTPTSDADQYVLGWTETIKIPERVPAGLGDDAIKAYVDEWAAKCRSLLIAVQSSVLPEADVLLLNAGHPDSVGIPPLTSRPFSFSECLHRPPMADLYRAARDDVTR